MKREDLEKQGLSKEQIDAVLDMHHKEIDPVNKKLEKAQEDLKAEQEKVKTTEEALKAFDGVDPAALNQKIADLQKDLQTKDAEHQAQIADRDFQDMLKESIVAAKGVNPKAITALLDVEALKASKNQKEDIAEALKTLAEAEDSKMLFGIDEPEEDVLGKGNPIGAVTKKGSSEDAWVAQMMAAAGVSTEENK
jgi:hypothetical protein